MFGVRVICVKISDAKNETVLFPIFGIPVPFHVGLIKNIFLSSDGPHYYLRVDFVHPGTVTGFAAGSAATFVEEL